MGMIYQWKDGAHVSIDAQAAGEEMERIRVRQNGRLDQESVLAAARKPKSPLHPHFEWDDGKAAEAYRINQAGELIRWITVTVEKPNGGEVPVRAFVNVKREEDRSYTSIQHALSDEDLRAQVVAQAWAELEAWRKRYAELQEFATLFATIEQARAA
jgi:hypothetical protein